MKPQLIKLYDDGYRHGLLVGGDDRHVKVIIIDSAGLDVRTFSAEKEVYFTFYDEAASDKAVLQFIEMGKKFGITARAAKHLGTDRVPTMAVRRAEM